MHSFLRRFFTFSHTEAPDERQLPCGSGNVSYGSPQPVCTRLSRYLSLLSSSLPVLSSAPLTIGLPRITGREHKVTILVNVNPCVYLRPLLSAGETASTLALTLKLPTCSHTFWFKRISFFRLFCALRQLHSLECFDHSTRRGHLTES